MARTTQLLVQGILVRDYIPGVDLTPYIATANAMVTRANTCASDRGVSLSADELELMERWVAAHFYCAMDQQYSEKRTGDAYGKFQGRTAMGLYGTKYGQAAINLDFSGCLSSMSEGNQAQVIWLGKPPSEQIPYPDRN